jgi:transcriptional regulator with XRE-family HTH domain
MRKTRLVLPSRVGANIRKLRLQAGLSQDLLSEKAGIFRTYLSRVESGSANPTLLVLVALAQALNVPPGDLFK